MPRTFDAESELQYAVIEDADGNPVELTEAERDGPYMKWWLEDEEEKVENHNRPGDHPGGGKTASKAEKNADAASEKKAAQKLSGKLAGIALKSGKALLAVTNAMPAFASEVAKAAGASPGVAKLAYGAATIGDWALPGIPAGSVAVIALSTIKNPKAPFKAAKAIIAKMRGKATTNEELELIDQIEREVFEYFATRPDPVELVVRNQIDPIPVNITVQSEPVNVQVDVNPTPVQVDVAAPNVNIESNVEAPNVNIEAPSVEVVAPNVNVEVAAPNVDVKPPNVNIDVQSPDVNVTVEAPAKEASKVLEEKTGPKKATVKHSDGSTSEITLDE